MSVKLSRRRLVGSVAAGGAALSLGAGRFGARPAAAATELTWAVDNFAPVEVDLVQKVVDNFVAAHPDFKVKVLGYDPNAYDTKLIADVAAGTLPDIFVNFDVQTKTFFEKGLTADLKPYMDKTGPKVEDFDQNFISLAIDNGKVGFLPRAGDVVVMYYTKRCSTRRG